LAFDGQHLWLYSRLYLLHSSKERDLIGMTSTGEGKMAHFRWGGGAALYFPAQFQESEQPCNRLYASLGSDVCAEHKASSWEGGKKKRI